MEKLWTTEEVATYLGITEVDVEQLVKQGKLTGYKLGGRFLRFRPEQAQALKDQAAARPMAAKAVLSGAPASWTSQLREFVYFYDFYIISAALLAVVVVYLVVSG